MEKEQKCGGCAFLLYEDAYGYGSCPYDSGELRHCGMNACQNHIERDKVRHSAAVLAQFKRVVFVPCGENVGLPKEREVNEAIDVITRYINVITKKI